MGNTLRPTDRFQRRAAESDGQPSASRDAAPAGRGSPDAPFHGTAQPTPTPPVTSARPQAAAGARKGTHITRSFTPPEPSAYADRPASPPPAHPDAASTRVAAPAGRGSPGAPLHGTARPTPMPPEPGARPQAAASLGSRTSKGESGASPSPRGPGRKKTRGRGKAVPADAPLTPQAVIRQRRRRCADARDITDFLGRLAAMVVLLALLFGFAFGITPMANDDMAPRISAGDLLLYYRLADDWANGDVMVFEKDGEQYVGRIVARGGDTVEVTDQATLVVNGSTVLENDIYYTTPKYDDGPAYPVTLAQDEFFILCDYREGARDSRYFGPVRASEVKGKVITVVRRSGL